jgi:hypothetical protein
MALARVLDYDHVAPQIGRHVHRAAGRGYHLTSGEAFGRVKRRK